MCSFSGRLTRVWIHWTLVFILHRVGMATAMASASLATYTGKMRKTWHFRHNRESLLQNRSHKRVKWHFCVKLFVPRSSSKGEKYIRILHVHKIKTILHLFQNCCYDAVGVRLLCVVDGWWRWSLLIEPYALECVFLRNEKPNGQIIEDI